MSTEDKDRYAVDTVTTSDGPDLKSNQDRRSSRLDTDDYETEIRERAWGRNLKVAMWAGIGIMWTIFQLDNATVYAYQNVATSEFREVSLIGALSAAGTIVSAVLKPPIAKISDVAGRAETYIFTISLYLLSYILACSANGFNQYAGSYIIYCVGQTGTQILNQLLVADITTSKWRALANSLANIPALVIPWIAAFIVDSALANIGWRWGIGMFGFLMPVCAASVIIPQKLFQRRMKRLGASTTSKSTLSNFVSQIDLGGMFLLCGGFALILLPLALAAREERGWATPWVPAVIVVGGVLLMLLVMWERFVAAHPIVPIRFLKNVSLLLAWTMGILDSFAFSATHTYMFTWVSVVHGYSSRDATFLTFTAGCMQVLAGICVGFAMLWTRRYKWIMVIGVFVRLLGYGVMLRLRGADNSTPELFIVQLIQGIGSGIVQTIVLVIAQVVVPRAELAQSTAVELLFVYMGNAIGSTAAGAIYTNTFAGRLEFHLPGASQETVDNVLNTFTEITFESGTPERSAINLAYSDVMRYMTFAGLGASVFGVVLVWGLPDLKLSSKHNLASSLNGEGQDDVKRREGEGYLGWWWRTGRLF